jgi:hypothetical protein
MKELEGFGFWFWEGSTSCLIRYAVVCFQNPKTADPQKPMYR